MLFHTLASKLLYPIALHCIARTALIVAILVTTPVSWTKSQSGEEGKGKGMKKLPQMPQAGRAVARYRCEGILLHFSCPTYTV